MKIKSTYLYQLSQIKKAFLVYYIIKLSVVLLIVSALLFPSLGQGFIVYVGFESTTMLFLFIVFGESFKSEFLMLTQNSISRKTIIKAKLFILVTISLLVAIFDRLIELIINSLYSMTNPDFKLTTFITQLYPQNVEPLNSLFSLLLNFSLFLVIASFGYTLGIIFYRLGSKRFVLVFIGLLISYFTILAIDVIAFKGVAVITMIDSLDLAFGISAGKPINCIIACIFLFILSNGISYRLIIKAPVHE